MADEKPKGKTYDMTDPKYGKYELVSGHIRKEAMDKMGIKPTPPRITSPRCPHCNKLNTSKFISHTTDESTITFVWLCIECDKEFVNSYLIYQPTIEHNLS